MGASVEVNGLPTEYEGTNHGFSMVETKTDAQGRWHIDVVPKDVSTVSVHVKHPRYRQRAGEQVATLGRDSVFILKKGLTVTGRVIDAAGRPVRGARAFIGADSFDFFTATGTTNELGKLSVEHCTPGPKIITVQAEGFAPHVADVGVNERTALSRSD